MGLFGKILKTGLDVVTSPFEIANDIFTIGNIKDESYTMKRLKQIAEDGDEVEESLENLWKNFK